MEDSIAAAKESVALVEDRVSRELSANMEKATAHVKQSAEQVLKDVNGKLDVMDAKFSERHAHGRNEMVALKKSTEEAVQEIRDEQSTQKVELAKDIEGMQKLVENHRKGIAEDFGEVKESLHARMHNLSTTTTTHIADLRSTATSHNERLLQTAEDLVGHRENVGKELGTLASRCDRLEKGQEDDARALESVRSIAASLKQTIDEQRQTSLERTGELEKKVDDVSREVGVASSSIGALQEKVETTNDALRDMKTKAEVKY